MDIRMIGLETFIPFLSVLRILFAMKYSKDNILIFKYQKYTKHFCLVWIFLFLLFSCHSNDQSLGVNQNDFQKPSNDINNEVSILIGANQLSAYFDIIKNKRVAVVGNQSSLLSSGIHLVDTLLALNHNVVKVFSPEHGFRGVGSAGEHISNSKDPITGLPIVSLYGSHKKPTVEDLNDIDVVLLDIQDVGVRFYTYISTLHYVMEACAENDIPLVILDRPNPNGDYIDGPILESKYKSFVGMHPVPIVHGMTIGEYGKMINGEQWLKNSIQCELVVIPMLNYNHQMKYSLPIPPSPNLKTDAAIRLYPSLCLLEATSVSVGRGTSAPFEWYGHPMFPKSDLSFTPKSIEGASKPKHENKKCFALKPQIDYTSKEINLEYVIKSRDYLIGEDFITRKSFFQKLSGTDKLHDQIVTGLSEEEIRKSWQKGLDEYALMRSKYLLYD